MPCWAVTMVGTGERSCRATAEALSGSERGTGWGLVPRPDRRRSKENRVFGGGGVPETCGEDPGPCRRKGAKSESGFSFFFIFFFPSHIVVQAGACRGFEK